MMLYYFGLEVTEMLTPCIGVLGAIRSAGETVQIDEIAKCLV